MDDNQFDDILKGKLEEFPEESFDPAALADLHYKMAQTAPVPWYVVHKAELLTAAAVVIVLLFNGILYFGASNNTYEKIGLELSELRADNAELLERQNRLIEQSEKQIMDTLIIERQDPGMIYELNLLRAQLDKLMASAQSPKTYTRTNDEVLFLGYRSEISQELLSSLSHKGLIRYQEEEVYLLADGYIPKAYPHSPNLINSYAYDGSGLGFLKSEEKKTESKVVPGMDLATKNELEKHYMKGVGLRLGPALGVNIPFYEKGEGSSKVTYGVMADLIFSPSISLESGVIVASMSNELESSDNLDDLNKPGFDPGLGELSAYEIDTELIEFPLNLKYRYPISDKSYLLGSIGYTAMLYTKQQIEYEQLFDSGDPLGVINVSSGVTENSIELSPGTANISLGISTRLKGRNYLELGAQYRLGLGPMGVEEINNSFLGFRAAYWFHVR